MISGCRQSALHALMPALAQCLAHGCATETCLTRAVRVNFHQLAPSFCRFVRKCREESRPSGIVDGLGEHAAGQAFDVQVFYGNEAIGIDQRAGHFVVEVGPLITDMCVRFLQKHDGLAASTTAALTSRHTALGTSEMRLGGAVGPWVVYRRAVAQGRKREQAHIKTYSSLGL